jgi:hypothetical protein
MKKVALFFAFAIACVSGAFAQKQTGGEKNLEVQFAPLGGNPVSISGIRLRLFNSETSAIRIGLFVGGSSSDDVTAQAGEFSADSPELHDISKEFSFSLRPGYEMHFAGTDRLSPYIGGEILIGISRSTTDEEVANSDDSVGTITTKDGSTTFGLNAVAGCDFYFSDAIYLGVELGFGYAGTSNADTEITYDNLDTDDPDPTVNGKSSSWGPNYQGTIRLGWLFN